MFDVVMKATNDSGLVVGEVTNNFRVLWGKKQKEDHNNAVGKRYFPFTIYVLMAVPPNLHINTL